MLSCQAFYYQANPKIYSAGLDILEMYNPQPDRLMTFWRTLQEVWLKLYGSRLPTIAAINVSFIITLLMVRNVLLATGWYIVFLVTFQGPVVQSIVSLTILLRDQLVKSFMTL